MLHLPKLQTCLSLDCCAIERNCSQELSLTGWHPRHAACSLLPGCGGYHCSCQGAEGWCDPPWVSCWTWGSTAELTGQKQKTFSSNVNNGACLVCAMMDISYKSCWLDCIPDFMLWHCCIVAQNTSVAFREWYDMIFIKQYPYPPSHLLNGHLLSADMSGLFGFCVILLWGLA